MLIVLAILIGWLYATAVYLLLRRSLVKLVLGLGLLSHAANLLIFTASGLRSVNPPIIPPGGELDPTRVADPLPQALILTAIVIGFGVLAFALVLLYRAYEAIGADDLDQFRGSDE